MESIAPWAGAGGATVTVAQASWMAAPWVGDAQTQNDCEPAGAANEPEKPWSGPAPVTCVGATAFGSPVVSAVQVVPKLIARCTGAVGASGRTAQPAKLIVPLAEDVVVMAPTGAGVIGILTT